MDGYWMSASEVIEINPCSKAELIHRDQELYLLDLKKAEA